MSILHVNYWNWQTILNLCKKSYKGVQLSKTYPLLKKSSLLSKKVWKCVKFLCKRIDNGKTSKTNLFTKNLIIKIWFSNPKQLTPIRISNSNKKVKTFTQSTTQNHTQFIANTTLILNDELYTTFWWFSLESILYICWLIPIVNLFGWFITKSHFK